MHWGKPILGVAVGVLGVIFLVLCVAGIGGAWMFRSRAIPAVAEASDSAAETLAVADKTVDQFRDKVARVRKALAAIEREARRLAALPPDEIAAATLVHGNEQVIEYLKPAMAVANSLEVVAGSLDKGLARWQTMRSGQAEVDRLRAAIRGLAETAASLERARVGLLEQTPAAVGRFADEVHRIAAQLDGVEESLKSLDADLAAARTDIETLTDAAPRWLTVAAWAVTLVLAWFALSQISVLLHAWSLIRGDRTAGMRTPPPLARV